MFGSKENPSKSILSCAWKLEIVPEGCGFIKHQLIRASDLKSDISAIAVLEISRSRSLPRSY